ncbi:nitrous oxide reductase accessory protein NosL [Calidifontibacillus erzurumensis]|uniref:nitrous oxide reductase accessory protein NosL n=1 Tax=Calidifontibacillus erzurumensis TaxID=2741433 RepID=UPI0035B56D60
MKVRNFSVIILLLLGILAGCSGKSAFEPVSIDTNVDSCDECHMGIQNLKASSEVILKDGTPKKFDDIGCMIIFLRDHLEEAANIFVHDYHTDEWVNLYEAYFVQNDTVSSPMGYNFAAFKSQEEAYNFKAEHGGELYTPEKLLKVDVEALKAAGHGDMEHTEHQDGHSKE